MAIYKAVVRFNELYDLDIEANSDDEALAKAQEHISKQNDLVDINDNTYYELDYLENSSDDEVIVS